MTHLSLIPERKDAHARPTSNVVPHPRHRVRRLYDAQSPTSRANHPVYNDYELHLVDNEFDNHFDDDRSRTRGANVTPHDRTLGAVDGGLPTGDRQSDPRVLGPVRTRDRRVGDRDRLARVELPTGREQSNGLLLDLPDGTPPPSGSVRRRRLSRLVRRALRPTRIHRRRSTPLRIVWSLALATLNGQAR